MKSKIFKHNRTFKIVRWIARVISSLAVAFFLFMCTGESMYDSEPATIEGIIVGGFAILLTVSVLISWWKERIGGIILTTLAIAFAIFIYITAGRYKVLASTTISSPFWISGVLFYISSKKNKH